MGGGGGIFTHRPGPRTRLIRYWVGQLVEKKQVKHVWLEPESGRVTGCGKDVNSYLIPRNER